MVRTPQFLAYVAIDNALRAEKDQGWSFGLQGDDELIGNLTESDWSRVSVETLVAARESLVTMAPR